MEILVALIIVGVLATIGIAQYAAHREAVLDKEADANLRLIQSAQRIYRMEVGGFVACGNTLQINNILRLMLPTGAAARWNYKVVSNTAVFDGRAQRLAPGRLRNWCMDHDDTSPASCTY